MSRRQTVVVLALVGSILYLLSARLWFADTKESVAMGPAIEPHGTAMAMGPAIEPHGFSMAVDPEIVVIGHAIEPPGLDMGSHIEPNECAFS